MTYPPLKLNMAALLKAAQEQNQIQANLLQQADILLRDNTTIEAKAWRAGFEMTGLMRIP